MVKTGIAGSLTRVIQSVKTHPTLRKQGTVICQHGESIICLVHPVIWKHVGGCRFGSSNTGMNWPDPVITLRALKIIPRSPPSTRLCCPLQVKCYHRRVHAADRDTVFRLQFHTCTVHGSQLWFGKGELDEACTGEYLCEATVGDKSRRHARLRKRLAQQKPRKFFSIATPNKWCVDLTGRSSCSFCHFFIRLLLQSSLFFCFAFSMWWL